MRSLLILTGCLAAACGGKDLSTPDHCNPLGGSACITPWPSSIYETDDAQTATKRRLDIPMGALPANFQGIAIDPKIFNTHDGFSSAAPMMTAFSTGVDPSNLVHYSNFAASLTAASPTVLVDMETGELVAHFAEIDARVPQKPESQALYIRPAKMLEGSRRYAVAIKKTLKAKGGGELPIPEGFQAILSGEETSHSLLERVRPRYKAIFDALAAHGIEKGDLVVAWDFTTRSRAQARQDLVNAKAAAMPLMGSNGASLAYTVTSDEPSSDTRIARRIDGTYDAPLFLTNNGAAAPTTTLMRDGSGKPMAMGLYRAPFTAIIPECALTSSTPVPLMIYGHGLLGNGTQTNSGGTRHAAAEICVVAIGTDMRGMSDVDVPNVALALNDGNDMHLVFDVLIQGMINHIALVQIARGPMANALFAKQGGGSLIDPDTVHYYGISQGGIMGTTVCGIDPVIKRCVVQVGAINYSLMLERSLDWPTYRTTLIGAYENPLIVALMINLMQHEWDRTEPTVLADVITTTGFPDTPPKQVFMQVAIADDEVANIASEYQARTMGIPVMTPSPYVPYGLAESAGPASSALILYDYGLGDTIPPTNEPPPDNDVHSQVRNKKATTDMMRHFYETGEIVQMCTAPKGCDCTIAGGCGDSL
jgi:hypothetical protein